MRHLLLFSAFLFILSCGDDDDPVIENEEEVITNFTYTLTPVGASTGTVVLDFSDSDGDGAQVPTITEGATLAANTVYAGALTLSNQSVTPPDNITLEILEEDENHQFFFLTEDGLEVDVTYADSDGDGNPLGILTELSTGAASSGALTIILRHEPNKDADGLTIDRPDLAGGETDIEVVFELSVED
jgi:hypothetical protein